MISSLLLSNDFSSYKSKEGHFLSELTPLARINMIVGSNNSGKSRFMRLLASRPQYEIQLADLDLSQQNAGLLEVLNGFEAALTSHRLTSADDVTLDVIRDLKELPTALSTTTDNYARVRGAFELWKNIQRISRTTSSTMSYGHDNSDLPVKFRELATQGLDILEKIPTESQSSSPGRYYIPILRGLRPLDEKHTDFYQNKTREDYFQDEGSAPEIYTGLSFYQRLTDLLLGSNTERKQIVRYQEFVSRELFEGREVVLIPSQKNKSVTIKIGKEKEQPVHHLGDGVQAAIILSFLPFTIQEPTFFFIEEPEVHMHPGLQRKVLELFVRNPNHTFFLTTHSNHLLDITIDLQDTSIFTFQKSLQHDAADDEQSADVVVEAVNAGHRSSLEQLGVRNSSVFLVNATIWVEGITDRWYLRAVLRCYLRFLQEKNASAFKPEEDVHYSFVEYGGNNITHWSFLENEDHPIEVDRLCARALVIADEDGDKKLARKEALEVTLGERLCLLKGREIENILPPEIIQTVIASYEKVEAIALPLFEFEAYQNEYLGRYIETNVPGLKRKGGYASDSGTIKGKVDFCERATTCLEKLDFEQLPKSTQELAHKIYNFIQENNKN